MAEAEDNHHILFAFVIRTLIILIRDTIIICIGAAIKLTLHVWTFIIIVWYTVSVTI
ncbi:MAG: hypothetical protein IPL08_13175 [Saprospiraceae bacterium]|nr:hypothetical protein [Saprospiraceae bacterium]